MYYILSWSVFLINPCQQLTLAKKSWQIQTKNVFDSFIKEKDFFYVLQRSEYYIPLSVLATLLTTFFCGMFQHLNLFFFKLETTTQFAIKQFIDKNLFNIIISINSIKILKNVNKHKRGMFLLNEGTFLEDQVIQNTNINFFILPKCWYAQ